MCINGHSFAFCVYTLKQNTLNKMWSYTDYTIYTAGCHSNPKYYHLLEKNLYFVQDFDMNKFIPRSGGSN